MMVILHLRRVAQSKSVARRKSAQRAATAAKLLGLESLEHRDLLTALAWASGENLPAPAAGLVAQPVGWTSLLLTAGGSTAAYYLSETNPSWQASSTPTNQSLDFARSGPGEGPLSNGYYLVYGGTQNGFATSAVTQYDPNTVTVVDGATNQTRALRAMNSPRTAGGRYRSDDLSQLRDWRSRQQRHAAVHGRNVQPGHQQLDLRGRTAANVVFRVRCERRGGPSLHVWRCRRQRVHRQRGISLHDSQQHLGSSGLIASWRA